MWLCIVKCSFNSDYLLEVEFRFIPVICEVAETADLAIKTSIFGSSVCGSVCTVKEAAEKWFTKLTGLVRSRCATGT